MRKFTVVAMAILCVGGLALVGLADVTDSDNHSVTLDVNEIAVLALVRAPAKNLTLTIVAPDAGVIPAEPTDNATYLQYTSVLPEGGDPRTVTVHTSGATAGTHVPLGTALQIIGVGAPGGTATTGSAARDFSAEPLVIPLELSAFAIITGIGSGATGSEATDGAQITYRLAITDLAALRAAAAATYTVTITYTLTASVVV